MDPLPGIAKVQKLSDDIALETNADVVYPIISQHVMAPLANHMP